MANQKISDEDIKTFPATIGKGGKVHIPKLIRNLLKLEYKQVIIIKIVSYPIPTASMPITSTMM